MKKRNESLLKLGKKNIASFKKLHTIVGGTNDGTLKTWNLGSYAPTCAENSNNEAC
ncbi:hypothetical protein [uncultured Kordia sp.]|uniref:hypothetical protein n=1 Tax=uncultured Kordia sp. TaxID=507699 RepID=UPI0026294229|nr:hypothetical protein [uncultured Kordia sp.]